MRVLRVDGIPVHAALVHFPIAAWTGASLLGVGAVAFGAESAGTAAYWCNIVGLATGVLAIAAGALEFTVLPEDPGLRAQAASHMAMAGTTWILYSGVLVLQVTGWVLSATALGVVALIALTVTGHAGARIVFHHGFPRGG